MNDITDDSFLNPIQRMTRDLKNASLTLSAKEARFLVDAYYIMQDDRKRSFNQERALDASSEPHSVITWLANQSESLEGQIKNALDTYTQSHEMGKWMRAITGIGPVIAAGLLAYIDIEKAPTAGHIWSFAGWGADNQRPWEKGCKRPYSTQFRTLCWKAGQSFMKLSTNEKCFYGAIYKKRKEYEVARNETLGNSEAAKIGLARVKPTTEAHKYYKDGKLPPAHIDARARRYAVKLFLAHLHSVWYEKHYGTPAPMPYPIAQMGHAHYIPAPNGDKV